MDRLRAQHLDLKRGHHGDGPYIGTADMTGGVGLRLRHKGMPYNRSPHLWSTVMKTKLMVQHGRKGQQHRDTDQRGGGTDKAS